MEKKYPVIAGREKGKFINRRWVLTKGYSTYIKLYNLCKGINMISFVLVGHFWSLGISSLQRGNTDLSRVEDFSECRPARTRSFLWKMLPLALPVHMPPEHLYADVMLCPRLCLDVCCILHANCFSDPVHTIDQQSDAVSSRLIGCQYKVSEQNDDADHFAYWSNKSSQLCKIL